jgi:hypothetical protein
MLSPELDAEFVSSGDGGNGGEPAPARCSVLIIVAE